MDTVSANGAVLARPSRAVSGRIGAARARQQVPVAAPQVSGRRTIVRVRLAGRAVRAGAGAAAAADVTPTGANQSNKLRARTNLAANLNNLPHSKTNEPRAPDSSQVPPRRLRLVVVSRRNRYRSAASLIAVIIIVGVV